MTVIILVLELDRGYGRVKMFMLRYPNTKQRLGHLYFLQSQGSLGGKKEETMQVTVQVQPKLYRKLDKKSPDSPKLCVNSTGLSNADIKH